jgi:hypothetical protein
MLNDMAITILTKEYPISIRQGRMIALIPNRMRAITGITLDIGQLFLNRRRRGAHIKLAIHPISPPINPRANITYSITANHPKDISQGDKK